MRRLQSEGLLPPDVEHRTSKYLNNILEADHGALNRVIRPTRGFQTMKTAAATLTGFETLRMIRRGPCIKRERHATGEVRLQSALRSCSLNDPLDGVRYALFKLLQQCRLRVDAQAKSIPAWEFENWQAAIGLLEEVFLTPE